jgi:cytochrome c-type protein NapC
MDFEQQDRRVARRHQQAGEKGETCIDCHYGIVHKAPENASELMREIAAEFAGGETTGGT